MNRITEEKRDGVLEVIHDDGESTRALDVQLNGEVGLMLQGGYGWNSEVSMTLNADELRAVAAKMIEAAERLEGE